MLDRGVGLRHQRVEDLLGLEVVLPDGQLAHVGWWPRPDGPRSLYPHGLGPSPLPLFLQSNLGVVTAAAVRLLPRPEALRVVRLGFRPDALVAAITELRRWVGQGLTRGVPRVFDPAAARAYGGTDGEFLVHVCVDGTAAAVDALAAVIADEARASGLFSDVAPSTVDDLVERGYAGDPDVADTIFELKMGQPADRVDENVGFLFFLPLVPLSGEAVGRAYAMIREVNAETGVRWSATLHVLGPEVIDCVVATRFTRASEEAERAHRALDRLYRRFADAGFAPYRLDVDHAGWMDDLSVDDASLALVRRLKRAIDPHDVIAPGRYR
jgi:4-cresol dehydrogenase (hydroxylating)